MHIQKIWQSLSKLNSFYVRLMGDVINDFAQEIIDGDGFYERGADNIPIEKTIAMLQGSLSDKNYTEFEGCSLEFCITNEYLVEGKTWNCINHWIAKHKKLFSKSDLVYLKALNSSYVSVYKIASVDLGKSIQLQDMTEVDRPLVSITNKTLSKITYKNNFIAARLLQTKAKSGSIDYRTSKAILHLPEAVAQSSINTIKIMTQAMNSPLIRANASFDTSNDLLLQKKLWIKEILEQWYLHHRENTTAPVFH